MSDIEKTLEALNDDELLMILAQGIQLAVATIVATPEDDREQDG